MSASPQDYVCFDRVADIYESTRHIPPACLREFARVLREDGRYAPGAPFLDAGVGTGRFARHLADQQLMVVGADISAGMLRHARAAAPRLRLVRADLRRLPFAEAAFAGALFVHILHLIADWQRAVAEVRRALRPGAPLYVGSESGKHFRTRSLYIELATERGLVRPHIGASTFDAVLNHLADTGADLRQVDAGRMRWTARARVGEMLDTLRNNPFSSFWHIPPDVHTDLMRETERRAREVFLTLDAVEETPAQVTLWRASWPG